MSTRTAPNIREALLKAMKSQPRNYSNPKQILEETGNQLGAEKNTDLQRAILFEWQRLFTNGIAAWGVDFNNCDPPFFHLTDLGNKALGNISRDPANPDGYMRHLKTILSNPIAESYALEALDTFSKNCFKATAVMIGVAAESIVLDIRDAIVKQLDLLKKPANTKLTSWQAKAILDEIDTVLTVALDNAITAKRDNPTVKLREAFKYNWPSMTHMIRVARNDAGHPGSIDPVTQADVYATLLTFPHQVHIANQLKEWVSTAQL